MSIFSKLATGFFVLAGGIVGAVNLLPDYGTRLEFQAGELYYTPAVTEDEARRLGRFLVETGVFDDVPKTVQIDKQQGVYRLRMVIKPEFRDDPAMHANLRVYGKEVCNKVFGSAPVEIHMTDDSLHTERVLQVAASYGELLTFDAGELYFTPAVTRDEAEKLGTFLVDTGFFDDQPKTTQLDKHDGIYEFRFVLKAGVEPDTLQMAEFRQFARQISEQVFGSAAVDIHMADASLFTQKIVTSTGDFDRENAANGTLFPLLTEEMMTQIGNELLESESR